VAVGGEDLADRLRVREEDEGGAPRARRRARDGGEPDGEAVPVGPGALLHERQRPADPVEHLQAARDGWTGRQGRHGFLRSVSSLASMMPASTAPRPPKFNAVRRLLPSCPCAGCSLPAAIPRMTCRRSTASGMTGPA